MARSAKLIGMFLMIIMVSNGCGRLHRHLSDMRENTKMKKHEKVMESRQMMPGRHGNMGRMGQYDFQQRMDGRRGSDFHGPMNGMRRGMRGGPGMMAGRGMGQMGAGPMGMNPMRPGMMMLERIPNLTDKQKKEIADLRQSQQAEMKKLQDEMASKMQTMREGHRKKVLNLLSDEQKKAIESGPNRMNMEQAKTK
jgi:hypothetical protein